MTRRRDELDHRIRVRNARLAVLVLDQLASDRSDHDPIQAAIAAVTTALADDLQARDDARARVAARIDGRCSWCRDPMPVPERQQGGGRTKRFCSAQCRLAANRWQNDPEHNADRLTWLRRHRPGLDSQ